MNRIGHAQSEPSEFMAFISKNTKFQGGGQRTGGGFIVAGDAEGHASGRFCFLQTGSGAGFRPTGTDGLATVQCCWIICQK